MTLLKFDPFRSFEGTMKKMHEVVKDIEHGVSFETGSFKPRVDISEDTKNVYVFSEMPGMAREDIKVNISDDNILIIKGEKKSVHSETSTLHRTERSYGIFERSFVLPDNLDVEKISAKYEHGTLELVIPKKEPVKPKEVEVQIQ